MGNQKRGKKELRESKDIVKALDRENCDGDGCWMWSPGRGWGSREAVGKGRTVYTGTLAGRGSCLHPLSNNKCE